MRKGTLVLVDGANVAAMQGVLRAQIDWDLFKKFLPAHLEYAHHEHDIQPVRFNYYTAVKPADSNGQVSLRPLLDFLKYNGYSIIQKEAKLLPSGWKGNMDIEIAVDALTAAYLADVRHVVLVTGDGDFIALVRQLRMLGVWVTVASVLGDSTHGNICADELRSSADTFINLPEHIAKFKHKDYHANVKDR